MNGPLTNGATGPNQSQIRASIEIQRPPPADLFGLEPPPAVDLIQILLDRGLNKSGIAQSIAIHPAQIGRILKGQQTASSETQRRLLTIIRPRRMSAPHRLRHS
ncbi:hypothetical protein [Thiocystis violascens]|uniref:Uncharacterized protein n=1 Tax=Thiocystis violascens (strain ATCC 17096 / DSM 198 / 6111) TaxID=765911 RepID=I3Y9A6_THIV6|nr:hypothetical protein [Thiocystis violascens]AFL73574.1 hypothetical protein Thivi_1586 [Thiocystis violascens DSM 198]